MRDSHVMNYIEAPERSLVQRMDALKRANEIRTSRANFKKQMKNAVSKKDSADRAILLLLEPTEDFASMKVWDLIRGIRGFGKVKTSKHLKVCEISPSKTVGGLSPRQRAAIVRALRFGL